MIEFNDVTLQYSYEDTALLKGVSFTLCDGVNTLLCDTQSGKTSICRLILKDVKPSGGQIFVDGRQLESISHANLDILYLTGDPVFFERRSILYNIEYPLKVRKVAKQVRRGVATELAERLGVTDLKSKLRTLSTEQRKLVSIVRGLTVARKIVLWDDFFQNADADTVQKALKLFEGATQVIVTSNADLAQGNAVVLDGGKTVYSGDADGAKRTVEQLQWLYDGLRSK